MSDELSTAVGIGAAAWTVGKPLLEKVLGPTAEYLGKELESWTKKRLENTKRIFDRAETLLGPKIDEPGQVPPKVLKGILNEGSFADDTISADYFGGVLASSRSGVIRDDRGVVFTSLIGRLSTYQIRAHYIIYTCIRKAAHGKSFNFNMESDRNQVKIAIPLGEMIAAMDFQPNEPIATILDHFTVGLLSEQLIGARYAYGLEEQIRGLVGTTVPDMPALFLYTPSSLGFELYMWAHGKGDEPTNQIQYLPFEERDDIQIPSSYRLI